MIILVPAYEPDRRLVDLVRAIRSADRHQPIVVVDDGSGPAYAATFAAAADHGCDVVHHTVNSGKGAALKTGFAHIARRYPGHDVVTADCDGQHTLPDILRVARGMHEHRAGITLGARHFGDDVPLRSKFGNEMTRVVFRLATGISLRDTQTGLRGYPAWLLAWLLDVEGDRFEYELEVLLAARAAGLPIYEVAIETIYLDGNESSHFHPIRDSIRVYVPFLRFCGASLAAFALDAVLFFVLMATVGRLAFAVVAARVVSAGFNFAVNRRLVFGERGRSGRTASIVRYVTLAVAILVANYSMIAALTAVGVGLVVAKFATELTLFLISYAVQRRFVFHGAVSGGLVEPGTDAPSAGDRRVAA